MCSAERPKEAQNETAEMLQPPLTWSLSPRAVLIAQGKREATVIPIFTELQGRPKDD